jgi:RNA polymerase sigma-70 factor, ECF subfamily
VQPAFGDYLKERDPMRAATRQDDLYHEASENYGHALERLVRAYEADPDKQRDLLQEVHFAVWQSCSSFEGRCSLRTWVYRVAHNTAASYALRERRSHASAWVGLDDLELTQDSQDAYDNADRRLALDKLMELIRRLRPPERQLMLLYLEGMDADLIGEVAGISAGHVRVQIHRIKAALARRFHGALKHER